MIPSERASQEEQNGTNFSFVAPSSEELVMIVHGFRPEIERVNFGYIKSHLAKQHLKGSRMSAKFIKNKGNVQMYTHTHNTAALFLHHKAVRKLSQQLLFAADKRSVLVATA